MCPKRLPCGATDQRRMRRAARGMTLIELMIVVAVVALLGAVALPAYQNSVRKAHRAEAKAKLTEWAQQLERFYTEHNYSYAADGAASTAPAGSSSHYALELAVSDSNPSAYTIKAVPQGAQAEDACGSFTLDQTGKRGVTGSLDVSQCW